jgi:2-polyprenyl-6-methoxyphenol hydroxylase-like FAD-dependent oxidoreductase
VQRRQIDLLLLFLSRKSNVQSAPQENFRLTSSTSVSQSELSTTSKEGFNVQDVSVADLVSPFSQLDPDCLRMLNSSIDRKPWRLYEHTPLIGWTQGRTGLLGDACHAMFPHQSQ